MDNDVEGMEFLLLSLTSSATSLVTVSPDKSEATVNIRDLTGELVGSSTVVQCMSIQHCRKFIQ